MMTGKEKLYFLLNTIADKKEITPSGKPILIHPMGDLNGEYPQLELMLLFAKLKDDEKVLKVTRTPLSEEEKGYNPRYEDDYYGLELLPAWGDYFAKIQQEPEYKAFSPSRIATEYEQTKQTKEIHIKDTVYEVKYLRSREILVNNFLIAKPDFNRENEVVFTYIYNHPNERISKDKIEKETGIKLTKTLPKILENLGFIGETRKSFFDVSSEGVLFRNPITKKDLDELGIKYLRLK